MCAQAVGGLPTAQRRQLTGIRKKERAGAERWDVDKSREGPAAERVGVSQRALKQAEDQDEACGIDESKT